VKLCLSNEPRSDVRASALLFLPKQAEQKTSLSGLGRKGTLQLLPQFAQTASYIGRSSEADRSKELPSDVRASAPPLLLKHSLQKTGLSPVGLNGTSQILPQLAHVALCMSGRRLLNRGLLKFLFPPERFSRLKLAMIAIITGITQNSSFSQCKCFMTTGAANYALQAISRATNPSDADATVAKERDWQYYRLLELERKSS